MVEVLKREGVVGVQSRMVCVWLLLLFPLLPRAQLTPDVTVVSPVELDRETNSTGASDVGPSSPSTPGPLEPSGYATTEAPTQVDDDWTPAEVYLYSGDASTLKVTQCSRAYSTQGQNGSLPLSFSAPLRPALDALTTTANILNMIFQASDLRESTVQEDIEWYHALVRALLEADLLIRQAVLTFDADPSASVPQLVLRATRKPMAKVQSIVLQDLSKAWQSLHPPAPAPDDSWFKRLKFPDSNSPTPALSKRVLLNDLSTLDTPKWGQGDSYVTNISGVRWTNAPFLDCKDGRFVPGWILTLSTSFYGLKPDLSPEFRGVIRVDVNIQDMDLDQCAMGDSWFADTHQCNRTTMECIPTPGQGFRLGQYCCRCKEGYYNPDNVPEKPDGGPANRSDNGGTCYPSMPICLPCWPGCKSCQDGTPCRVQQNRLLRATVLVVQGGFMTLVFVSMLAAYRHRRNRRIRASGLLLLETILFGSLLLYFPVFIQYFRPSTFRCILLRWVRMLGFSIVYGTVTLKMYRVLKAFLSRTAQRVPYMSSLHLLRILGVMLMTVSWFLCAWTVGVLQNRDRNIPVFVTGTTSDGQDFNLCYLDRWDYMMALAELLFLCWGSSLWTAVRTVPSAFHEPRYMGFAIHNELLLSSMFHLFRFTFTSLHPDLMLLLSFTHTHVTITVTLALLFIPKFLLISKPGREEIAAEVYEEEVDLRRAGSYLNSSFHSAWSEASVDPDDFRDELKKLYAQLEVHKTKKMATNNPHLSKKRSSRCALGRSIIKRIAEIPESMSRQCSREDRDGSFRSRSVNMSDSFRRDTNTVSISYRSSIKSPLPSPSIHKSQSDHYYIRERESSLCGSMLKANIVKRSSQRSETDSLDIPPGVCKSASAQNLTIDTNLLHPDHNRLHKSWSLTSTSNHSTENVSQVNRGSTVLTRSAQSISDQTPSSLLSESYGKAEVCPWETNKEPIVAKSQRRVSYANSDDCEIQRPASPVALVCPWDHLPPVQKTPSEDNGLLCESPRPQVSVSASAPVSPRPKMTKDHRVFSFRSATTKLLSVKSVMGSMDAGSRSSKDGNLNKQDSVSHIGQESASPTPRTGPSSRRPSAEKKTLQKRSMTTADGKPCLVKQNAVRLSSGDSSDRSPRRLVIVKSVVSPWDVDDMQKDGNYENVFLSRQNSKRSSISSWDTASSSRTPSTNRRGSYLITPVRKASHADICPWEVGSTLLPGEGHRLHQGNKVDVCPWDSQQTGQSNVCPWESQETGTIRRQGSGRAEVCPWESSDNSDNSQTTLSKVSIRQQSVQRGMFNNEHSNICPWDVHEKSEIVYENINPVESKGALAVPSQRGVQRLDNNPEQKCQTGSTYLDLSQPVSKTADSCPWDFPEPPKFIDVITPCGEGSTVPTKERQAPQMTIKVDICPWKTENQSEERETYNKNQGQITQDPARVNICPWESEEGATSKVSEKLEQRQGRPPQSVLKNQQSVQADVCPWETEEPKVLHKQDSSRVDVCPWETEEPKVLHKQDSSRANVCPWDTEEPKVLRKQDSSRADVCPWETEEPKLLKKQDSARADVCPWDTEEPKVLKKQDSSRADVCPWDTEEPEVLKKQDSSKADVCPWETEEPEVLKTQDSSKADVCPWETEEPKVLKKQDSSRADVCPWETDEPKVLKKQDSSRADVCPWETEEPKVLKKQDTSRVDVCPWDTEEPKVLKKQDSSRADVCPWDTEEPEVLKEQDSSRVDVCPWETKETDIAKLQGSGTIDTGVADSKASTDTDIPNSDKGQNNQFQGEEGFQTQADMSTEQMDVSNSNLTLGRRDALCPWEMVRSRSSSFTDASDVFTWEPENIPEEDEEDDAECAAEALVFPPDL